MQAFTVKGDWALKIYNGEKTIETRTYNTNYRGPVLITCSKYPENKLSGKAFAIAKLINSRMMETMDEAKACCKVYPKARSWVLADIRKIKLFPVNGQLRLFEIDTHGQIELEEE